LWCAFQMAMLKLSNFSSWPASITSPRFPCGSETLYNVDVRFGTAACANTRTAPDPSTRYQRAKRATRHCTGCRSCRTKGTR
jgi:hypothetical protein